MAHLRGAAAIQNCDRGLAHIAHLGAAALIAGEVISRNQRIFQHGMVGIDAGIDHGNGHSRAGDFIYRVRRVGLNEPVAGLIHVAVPNRGSVVGDWSLVRKIRRRSP